MASYTASSHRVWPLHGGKTGALIRSRDWSATPLGDPGQWPERFRAAVDTCLDAAFASFVWWGPELIQLYNDAALPIVQGRHPAAFGVPAREAWPDVWPTVGPMVESVMSTGRPVLGANMPLAAPGAAPASISFACSALRDAAGEAAGVLVSAFGATGMACEPPRHHALLETMDGYGYPTPAFNIACMEACGDALAGDDLASRPDLVERGAGETVLAGAAGGRPVGRARREYPVERIRWVPGAGLPLAGGAGHGRHAGRVSRDAAGEGAAADRVAVMGAELQHRTRNLIAVVRAIISRTLATSPGPDQFRRRIDDRLRALSRVQGLLSRAEQEPVTVGALVRLEFEEGEMGGRGARRERVEIVGPAVRLRSSIVQTLALALHELAANARKHGALSARDGRLQIGWWLEQRDRRSWLMLNWVEDTPRRAGAMTRYTGYGRAFIEQALPYSHGAETRYELDETGLWCSIALPLGVEENEERRP